MIYLFINNIVSTILIFFAYYFGLTNGLKINKGQDISIGNAIKEKKQEKNIEKEKKIVDTIMSNIDAYDGTGNGQKDIPI